MVFRYQTNPPKNGLVSTLLQNTEIKGVPSRGRTSGEKCVYGDPGERFPLLLTYTNKRQTVAILYEESPNTLP